MANHNIEAHSIRLCINALLLPKNLGGIGNYTYHLIKSLGEANSNLSISLLINSEAAKAFRSVANIKIIEVNIKSRMGRLFFLHFIFPFKLGKTDILHSVGNMGLIICPAIQVITIHDVYECVSPERFSFGKRKLMRFLVATSGMSAHRILTDSNNSARDVAKYYPHLASKISVVYLGNKFPITNMVQPDGRSGFLFLGTVEPGKNLALTLAAYAKFLEAHPNGGRLTVIGASGWKQGGLPALIESLGIAHAVDFMGYITDEQLPAYFRSAIALIQASNYEGFGLPVIEAMACGCPVISAYNSGLIEAGGNSAQFFDTGSLEGLFSKMEFLFGDAEARRQCIVTGFAHAAKFQWKTTAAQTNLEYASALKTMLKGKAPIPPIANRSIGINDGENSSKNL